MSLQTSSQSQLAERGRYAVAIAPEIIRRELDTERYARLWLTGFEAALTAGRRDAQRLYVELLEMVGASDRALEVAMRALGVASVAQAQSLIGLARTADGLDTPAMVVMARELLEGEGWRCLPPEGAVSVNGHSPLPLHNAQEGV
jgi:hypothetical protein